MATGLTFGTISALFALQNHIIDQRQYTILVSVVILSAFIPTLIAQKLFQPQPKISARLGPALPAQTGAAAYRGTGQPCIAYPHRSRRLTRRAAGAHARTRAREHLDSSNRRDLGSQFAAAFSRNRGRWIAEEKEAADKYPPV